jgi:hypothetical protein
MCFRGALVPAAATAAEIRHHLSVGLIRAVGAPAAAPTPQRQQPAATSAPEPEPEDTGVPESEDTPQASASTEQLSEERVKARKKLPADGSLPHRNAGKSVWVEAAVIRGYAYEAATAVDKAELVALLKA